VISTTLLFDKPPVPYVFCSDSESRRSLHQKRVHRLQRRPARIDILSRSDDPAEASADKSLVDRLVMLEADIAT